MATCGCGCGGFTKSRFVPGHDAKLKSRLLQAMRAGDETAMDELISRGWMGVTTETTAYHYEQAVVLPAEETSPDRKFENDLMDRVAKILALQMNAGTEEEAQAAAAMAQKIAFKYNLDLAEIARGTASGTGTNLKHIIKGRMDIGPHKGWVESLVTCVARHSFCRIVWTGENGAWVIGERHNILIVDYMFQFLRRTIDRLSDGAWAKRKNEYKQNGWYLSDNAGTWKDGYREGAVSGVHAKLAQQRNEDVAENTGGNALVVMKDGEAEAGMNAMFPNLIYGKSRKVNYGGGYNQGQRDGYNIQVNKGVGGAAKVPALRG